MLLSGAFTIQPFTIQLSINASGSTFLLLLPLLPLMISMFNSMLFDAIRQCLRVRECNGASLQCSVCSARHRLPLRRHGLRCASPVCTEKGATEKR